MRSGIHKPAVTMLGGDSRNVILARMLKDSGYDVLDCVKIEKDTDFSKLLNRKCLILPLPVTRDGDALNAPLSDQSVRLDDIISRLHPHNTVIGGNMSDRFVTQIRSTGAATADYYLREDVLRRNADLTAEGTLAIIMQNTARSIKSLRFLIVGYGRCGRSLASLLRRNRLDVTVASRSKRFGIGFKKTSLIKDYVGNFDVIVNTAPSLIFDRQVLSCVNDDSLIIELASSQAGIDSIAVKELNKRYIYAPAIPGRFFPESAAEILYDSIIKILTEEFA